MKTAFLVIILIIYVLAALSHVLHLGKADYPRTSTTTAWEDLFCLLLELALATGAFILLFQ